MALPLAQCGSAHSAVAVHVIAGYYAITTGAEVGGHRYLWAPLIGPPPVRLYAAGLGATADGSVRKHVTGRVMEGKVKRFEGARKVAGRVEGVDGETALEPKHAPKVEREGRLVNAEALVRGDDGEDGAGIG